MNKYLPKINLHPSVVLVAVHPDRMKEEYNLGKLNQMKDEHERKLVRIYGSLGITAIFLIAILMGASPSILSGALILQFILSILL
jgi:hypothetical protein